MVKRAKMELHPTVKERLERMNDLLKIVKENGGTITIDKLSGLMGLKYGLSERKIKEYIRQLESVGKLTVDWLGGIVRTCQEG